MTPQFGLRHILAAMAVLAVFSWVAADAVRGRAWAAGVSVAVLCLAITLGFYAGLFLLARAFAPQRKPSEKDTSLGAAIDAFNQESPFKSA
jgi:hypothetical protein